jgi:tetratricopeptide (TPR) repeat protein
VGTVPNAVAFSQKPHGTLGWFVQDYLGERVVWAYGPSALIVRLPSKKLTLVSSGNLMAARLQDGNVARSAAALLFFKEVAGMHGTERDEQIDQAFIALASGNRPAATALARSVLDKFPELESTPDVTLLYLFAQLGLQETEASATAVIRDHPSLPTAWFYYGQYVENNKRYREAAACFEKITMHEPPWHNWTVAAAKKELTYLKTY